MYISYIVYRDIPGFQRSRFLHPSDAADRSLGEKEGTGGGRAVDFTAISRGISWFHGKNHRKTIEIGGFYGKTIGKPYN
jgi:hypothetical protein